MRNDCAFVTGVTYREDGSIGKSLLSLTNLKSEDRNPNSERISKAEIRKEPYQNCKYDRKGFVFGFASGFGLRFSDLERVIKCSRVVGRGQEVHFVVLSYSLGRGGVNGRELFSSEQCGLGGEGEDDVFHFRQWLAGLEIAPYFPIPVGEASESLALDYREVFHRGVWFFFFAYGKVAHGLNHGCFFRRLLLRCFNLHKFLKAAAQSSQGSSYRL